MESHFLPADAEERKTPELPSILRQPLTSNQVVSGVRLPPVVDDLPPPYTEI